MNSKNCLIEIPIEENYSGGYRLEYDGKYITLLGKDKNYKGFKFNADDVDWFEEVVLIPIVIEVRNVYPSIKEVTNNKIIINLDCN